MMLSCPLHPRVLTLHRPPSPQQLRWHQLACGGFPRFEFQFCVELGQPASVFPESIVHNFFRAGFTSYVVTIIEIYSVKPGGASQNTSWLNFQKGFDACYAKTGRYIMKSIEYCKDPAGCGEWIADVANLWRTTGDVQNTWASVMGNISRGR
jgi:hypothetical protein